MISVGILRAFLLRDWRSARTHPVGLVMRYATAPLDIGIYYFIGRLVKLDDKSLPAGLHGGYFSYVLGGLLLAHVVAAGLSSFAARLRDEQIAGTLEALFLTPVRIPEIMVGLIGYELLAALVDFIVLFVCGIAIFGAAFVPTPATALALFIALPCAVILLLGVSAVVGSVAVVYKNPAPALGAVTLALTILGGVLFPIVLLPAPLRQLAEISPFTWAVDWMRSGLVGGPAPGWQLAGLVLASTMSFFAGMKILSVATYQARKAGTLAQY